MSFVCQKVWCRKMSGARNPSNAAMDLLLAENRRMKRHNRKMRRRMIEMDKAMKEMRENQVQPENLPHEESKGEEEVRGSRNKEMKDSGSKEVEDSRKEQLSMLKEFRELGPPSFKGLQDPGTAEDWIQEMEKTFDVLQCSDRRKVDLAAYMLKGEAYS